jgi:Cellulase (glycosyl hydrolase family 5)
MLGMPRITRTVVLAIVALAVLALLPATAGANSRQFSIFEDDAVFLGLTDRNTDTALGDAKGLGADAVRVVISWRRASPASTERTVPPGFDPSNPASPGYNWAPYDVIVSRARRHGLKVILDLSPSIPYWGSSEPARCPHFIAGKAKLGLGCYWKPSPRLFAKFASAVAKRYKGRVAFYSIWNEPNLENYLFPQTQKTKAGRIDLAAKTFRALWVAGYRAIRNADRPMRNRVLFGETAAISSPRDTLYSALCLNRRGRPYKGPIKKAQGCSKPSKLPIAGLSLHPYNQSALGNAFSRSGTKSSLTMAYLSRATKLLKTAEKYKRIPKGRGIYVTETGFQTKPPEPRGLSFGRQARAINEADRLFFDDPRIKSTAQFELYDVPNLATEDVFNTGLRTNDGTAKPSEAAYRMPLVVTRRSANKVEVWGQARPANGRARVAVGTSRSAAGPFKRLRTVRTNAAGYYRFDVRRRGAAKLHYQASWKRFASRVATAGKRVRYREKLPRAKSR